MKKGISNSQPEEITNLEPVLKAVEVVTLPSTDFVSAEKNLLSTGFFSPTSKNVKNVKAKFITFTRTENGTRRLCRVTIVPGALYGLPTTAHQDKFIAFMKLLESKRRGGIVSNPVCFHTSEMLRLLGLRLDAGKNYLELEEFFEVMVATTIKSEDAVYIKGKKSWASDMFHAFERAVAYGKELPDGTTAVINQVWLSEWMLDSINNFYTIPIEFEAYKQLKTPVAKALVPLLQTWLFVSEGERSFTKRYDELCQHLNITKYKYLSDIQKRFSPALDELKAHGYLKNWKLEKTQDGYKVVFYHGEKYFRDRAKRLESRQEYRAPKLVKQPAQLTLPERTSSQAPETITAPAASVAVSQKQHPLVIDLVTKFGVDERKAKYLVSTKPDEVKKQLGAYPLKKTTPTNPGGYIIRAIEHGYFVPPAYFEAQRKAEETKSAQARRDRIAACPLCDSSGLRMVTDGKKSGALKCSHNPEIEARYPSL
jgi:hypothetical protein